ncbi:MAG: TonB family protein [Candidatus Aminicenantes bacterium]|nr:TonB family protein [Candidatus Aminicenantes bacterium]
MRKRKILIVDFDEEAISYLSEYLKSENYNVSSAIDGEAGLEKCKAEMPDLVIVEPMISKLHGFELCSIIKHDFNGKIPVVILTKFYREEQFKIEAMRSYGASAFLRKPFRGPEILTSIKTLLKENTTEDEGKDMAEDTQALNEISAEDLEILEENIPSSIPKTGIDAFEQEIRSSYTKPDNTLVKNDKGADINQKIDKMLEDTLSEFGLNISKKKTAKSQEEKKLRDKVDFLVEKTKEEEKNKTIETKEIKKESAKAEKPPMREINVKEPESKNAEQPQAHVVQKKEEETPEKKEQFVFSEEREDDERIPLFQHLRNSLSFLKKVPLKFLIPSVLVAAIAVSAPFYFRKPSQQNSKNGHTAAVKTMSTQYTQPAESMAQENATEQEKPKNLAPVSTKETPAESKPEASTDDTQEGTVKTRVSEVYQVENPKTQKKPETNPINHSTDIISAEPAEELVEPLLPESEPMNGFVETEEPATRMEVTRNLQNSVPGQESTQTIQKETEKSPANEGPKTKSGDLIPLGQVDIPPEIATRIEPEYPRFALQRGVGGQVVINALISENGEVIETALVKGISGPYSFNEECEKAVRQWKFVPAFKDGVKVKVWKTISFNFKKS